MHYKNIIDNLIKKENLFRVGILLILGFALLIRATTFWLPHWIGDQCHYIGLAYKIEKLGFDNFNIQGLNIGNIRIDNKGVLNIIYPQLTKSPNDKGIILNALKQVGLGYYDQPFYHKPPGLPFFLIVSHKIFAPNKDIYSVVNSQYSSYIFTIRPKVLFNAQFWAVIVPLSFSLGLIYLTYVLGKAVFSKGVGLLGAFIIAILPIDIMTSQKIWADDMLAFFVCAAIIAFIKAMNRNNDFLYFLSGIFCGIAVLAKQTGGYLVFAVYPMICFMNFSERKNWLSFVKGFFDKRFFIFCAGVLTVTGFWFLKIYQVFGDPLFLPIKDSVLTNDITGWFKDLASRPSGLVLFFIGLPFLCPLLLLGWLTFKKFVRNIVEGFRKMEYDKVFVFLWIVIIIHIFFLISNNEYRRILPIIPIMAVFSGYVILCFLKNPFSGIRILVNKKLKIIIVLLVIIFCSVWSVKIGFNAAVTRVSLLKVPF